MGAPTGPRAQNIIETKARILQAAIDQFAQHGLAGARVDTICKSADVSQRMVYHYYKDKDGLYVAVLENVLGQLRKEELKLKLDALVDDPMEGLLHMFTFTFDHFAKHPELIRLMAAENLMEAKFLKESIKTPVIASPMLKQIKALLQRGANDGTLRKDVDPVHLYVIMVGLSYFHKSNAYGLSHIFQVPMLSSKWQTDHYNIAREMLLKYLTPDSI